MIIYNTNCISQISLCKFCFSLQVLNCIHFFLIIVFVAETYVKEVQRGKCDPNAQPVIVKETPGTAFVDGQNGIGTASELIKKTVNVSLLSNIFYYKGDW